MSVVALENGMRIFKMLANARILFIQHDLADGRADVLNKARRGVHIQDAAGYRYLVLSAQERHYLFPYPH